MIVLSGLFPMWATGASVLLNSDNLGSPTRLELTAGYTVENFSGYSGLTLTVIARGNHDAPGSPTVGASGQFSATLPSVNGASAAGYDFTFDGGGAWMVVGVNLTSSNNIYSRNIGSTGFQARERAVFEVTGGVWDSISANPGGNTGQLQISAAGQSSGRVSINLPTTAQTAFNTSGFVALGSGESITGLSYTYDFASVTNGGQAPNMLEANQPFRLEIEVVPVPEPRATLFAVFLGVILFRRCRNKS